MYTPTVASVRYLTNAQTHLNACSGIPHSYGWPCSCFPRCHETPIRANPEGHDLSTFVPAEIALAVFDTKTKKTEGRRLLEVMVYLYDGKVVFVNTIIKFLKHKADIFFPFCVRGDSLDCF